MLSYRRIMELVEAGSILVDKKYVQSASVDVHLSENLKLESPFAALLDPMNPSNTPHLRDIKIHKSGYMLRPRQIFLGVTVERFNLPNNIVGEFTMKSSIARCFLNHLHSDHMDPGFNGHLTLEMVNMNEQHSIRLSAGMPIGQIKFYEVEPVPDHILYSNVGQYNNQSEMPVASKGAR
jgi:dCTP deaminase